MKTFRLDGIEYDRYLEWERRLPPEPSTAIGGGMTYSFTPTSIGTVVKVTYYNGQEINVTDYDSW